jgi:hypothetical protein
VSRATVPRERPVSGHTHGVKRAGGLLASRLGMIPVHADFAVAVLLARSLIDRHTLGLSPAVRVGRGKAGDGENRNEKSAW